MKLQELITYLEDIAPLSLQETYDNAGLIIGSPESEINGVLVCLDSTEAVIDEAIQLGCNVVVAHHPIVFSGLKKLNGSNYIERTVIKAVKNDIAIYAIHTNLDNVLDNGVNQKIAQKLELVNCKILHQKSPETPTIGAGIIGELPSAQGERDFLHYLKEKMKINTIRHTAFLTKKIKRVALCGGSGRFLLSTAINESADVFISADFKYHEFFDSNNEILIADIGHYESEQYTIELLQQLINENFSTFAARSTGMVTNPIKYF